MNSGQFEIVAHRGAAAELPENTLPAFERAIELGADAVELDVRLTADLVPVVFHYFYLDEHTTLRGGIFEHDYEEIQKARTLEAHNQGTAEFKIPSLYEIIDSIGGRVGLEIEIKGPEMECVPEIARCLVEFEHLWGTIEVTSYEPALLRDFQAYCPSIATDLLFPRSETWMKADVITHLAIHRSKLGGARAVHLHPAQLSMETVNSIRAAGIEVHAWDVNDHASLQLVNLCAVPRICTDNLQLALQFREAVAG